MKTKTKKTQKRATHKKSQAPNKNNLTISRKARFRELDLELKSLFPTSKIALKYSTSWELLVAVILSAQCTDKKVNEVTARLFKKYKNLNAYLNADVTEFENDIRQTGFFRNKTRHILNSAKRIHEVYGDEVPCTMEDLLTLPGVARKTANIVLGTCCNKVEGIAVDTHVKRFAIRFNLTDSADPVRIEQDLMEIVPKPDWFDVTYRIIEYGRTIAPARKYDTKADPLVLIYPPAGKIFRV